MVHAVDEISAWQREYNEERPKKALNGLTPSGYAAALSAKTMNSTQDSRAMCYGVRGRRLKFGDLVLAL